MLLVFMQFLITRDDPFKFPLVQVTSVLFERWELKLRRVRKKDINRSATVFAPADSIDR